MCIPTPDEPPRSKRPHHLDLGTVATAWSGWTLHPDGRLYDPYGGQYTPGDLYALPYLWELHRELQRPRQYVLL